MNTQPYRETSRLHTNTVLAQAAHNRLLKDNEHSARHRYEYTLTKRAHRKWGYYALGILLLAGILYIVVPLLVR